MNNTKKQNIAKRDASIFEEYRRMFNQEGKRPGVICEALSDKYFLTPKSIERICGKQARLR